MSLPLKGLTVIALEQAVAAPFCTSRLADAGARVIKIERPEGDFARGYDNVVKGQSSYFVWLNRGKESLILDLVKEKHALDALLKTADVLVQNLKPGALERLGFSFDDLRKKYPRLILCSISGYGEIGEMANRKAYDLLIQAETGLCSLTGGAAEAARVGISLVDIATGATAHSAILEAIIARSLTGKGADIRVSMFDVMADWLTVPLLNHEGGKTPQRLGLAHPSIAPYGVFMSRDSLEILISIQSEREWEQFCINVLITPDLISHESFKNNILRVKNRELTDKIVRDVFASLDEKEITERLLRADIAYARVNEMKDLSKHSHLRRIDVETPNGSVSYPAPAPIFMNEPRNYGAVPSLGCHSF